MPRSAAAALEHASQTAAPRRLGHNRLRWFRCRRSRRPRAGNPPHQSTASVHCISPLHFAGFHQDAATRELRAVEKIPRSLFIGDDFWFQTDTGRKRYHRHVESIPAPPTAYVYAHRRAASRPPDTRHFPQTSSESGCIPYPCRRHESRRQRVGYPSRWFVPRYVAVLPTESSEAVCLMTRYRYLPESCRTLPCADYTRHRASYLR